MPVSMIIPSYNGLELLKRLLPSISISLPSLQDYEVIVVDDGSEDGTESYLRNHFPQIKVITLLPNMGFGCACNIGVKNARYDLICLLNNDVSLSPNFISETLRAWEENLSRSKKLYAITCKVMKEGEDTVYQGRTVGHFEKGEVMIHPITDEKGSTFFASGVMMVFQKDTFLELGGFDDLYRPFYWEDVDICYRALKKGYEILYEPQSLIYHKDQGTTVFSKKGRLSLFFAKMYARIIQERNQYLFTWKNILDKDLILRHIQWIPIQLLLSLKNKDHIFKSVGFIFALMRLKKTLRRRKQECEKRYSLSDREVLSMRVEYFE